MYSVKYSFTGCRAREEKEGRTEKSGATSVEFE